MNQEPLALLQVDSTDLENYFESDSSQNLTEVSNQINSLLNTSLPETQSIPTQETNETTPAAVENTVTSSVATATSVESEETIVVISDKDTSLTCIDLTDVDDQAKDNDVIIEGTVGSIPFVRNPRKFIGPSASSSLVSSTDTRGRTKEYRRRRNRQPSTDRHLDATIILDDENFSGSQAVHTRSSRVPDLFPGIELPSNQSVLKPSPPKRAKTTTSFSPKQSEGSGQSKQISCPICLETLDELKQNKKRLKSTFCGHILCSHCLEQFFKASTGAAYNKSIQCPTCRTKLTRAKIHDLFL